MGAAAQVYWNPENPAQSTLLRGDVELSRKMAHDARLQSGAFTALWVVLLLVPLIMLVVTRSRWKAAQQLGLGSEEG